MSAAEVGDDQLHPAGNAAKSGVGKSGSPSYTEVMLLTWFGLALAIGAMDQSPAEEWIHYVDRWAGFSIDLPKGMTPYLDYPRTIAGSVPEGLVLVIAFKGARPFRIAGLKFDSQAKRAAWPLKLDSYDVFEQLEFESGKAVHIERVAQPGTDLAYVEFDLLRGGWGWRLSAYCGRDELAPTTRYLKKIAESFRWNGDSEIQEGPSLTREVMVRLFEERAPTEDLVALAQAQESPGLALFANLVCQCRPETPNSSCSRTAACPMGTLLGRRSPKPPLGGFAGQRATLIWEAPK